MIGRDEGNDVVLADMTVSRRHGRLVVRDGKFIYVDLKSTHGTRVNGNTLRAPVVVTPNDRIEIASYALQILVNAADPVTTNFPAEDPTERSLLAAIVHGDPGAELVYADWLEERGETARAEFLRVQAQLAEGSVADPEAHGRRLLELCLEIDVRWRARVARPSVERCLEELTCPKQWSAMRPTAQDGVRHCDACRKNVYYCVSVPEAKARAREGACVALDLTSHRWRRDLEPDASELCRGCGRDVGTVRQCPHCGEDRFPSVMMVGRMAPP